MRVYIAVVGLAALGWCKDQPAEEPRKSVSVEETDPETTADSACDDFARGLCTGAPEACDDAKAILAQVELKPNACREGVAGLRALATVPEWQRLPVASHLLLSVLEQGGELTPEQVELIRSQARGGAIGGASEFKGLPANVVDAKLPESRGGLSYLHDAPVVRLSAAGARIEDGPIQDDLKSSLAPLVAKQVERARERVEEPELRVLLHADATTSARTVIETLEVTRAAGFRQYALVVREGETLSEIFVFLPHPEASEADSVVVDVGDGRTRIDGQTVAESAALAEAAAEIHAARDVTVATLRIDPDVPLQHIVTTLDTLRGPECDLDVVLTSADLPAHCHLFQPTLTLAT